MEVPVSALEAAGAPSEAAPWPAGGDASCDVCILGTRVRVRGPAALIGDLRAAFPRAPAWTEACAPAAATQIGVERDRPQPGWYEVTRDGTPLCAAAEREVLLSYLYWAVNTAAVEQLSSQYLLFHAGAAAYEGNGLILPATHGSGKTTLVAGLVAAGFSYLSDEVAVVDPASLTMLPFAKSLSVKPGSLAVLGGRYPQLGRGAPRAGSVEDRVWYVAPPGGAWPGGPVPVRYVVVPRYVARAESALTRISRSDALLALLDQAFSVHAHAAAGVARTVDLVQGADCYLVTVGSLDRAVDLLRGLLA